MFYKNTSYTAKTFYGVTFKPGEVKEVDGVINNKFMIIVDAPQHAPIKKETTQKEPSSETPKEDSHKASKAKQSDNKDKKEDEEKLA